MSNILAIMLGLTVVIICGCAFQYYQYISSSACLQGYWRIHSQTAGSYYMLIDGNRLSVIDTDTAVLLYDDADVGFKYRSIGALKSHWFSMTRSKQGAISTIDPLLDGRHFNLNLYPVIGAIHLRDANGTELRLVKDNQYSLDHLSM